jgi:hypothetical protein
MINKKNKEPRMVSQNIFTGCGGQLDNNFPCNAIPLLIRH